jgi:tetratricopeptide (TPR) repeat protein
MKSNSSHFRVVLAIAILISLPVVMAAQRKGGSPGKPSPNLPNNLPTVNTQQGNSQLLFVSGRVLLENGTPPPEPVVIEKVCNGMARRQGYTDAKGTFQIQVDQNTGFQDASESTTSAFSNDAQLNARVDALKLQFQGCEFRAVLPGFISSAVLLRIQGYGWQYELDPIFLKPMENMPGTTISMTTLNAPTDAKHAYDKARKAYDNSKYMEAEKNLDKAIRIYPGFAAAWSLLGDIHQQQKQLDQAVKEYMQALSADSQFVNPAFGLALIAVQQKRWQDAAQFTDLVARLNSAAFPSAYFYNAVANYNLAKMEPAESSARKFKSLDTEHHHPDICLLLSQILTRRGDYPGAAQQLRDYLTAAPGANNAEQVREQLRKLEQVSVAKQQ